MAHITTERGSRPNSGRYIYQTEMDALVERYKGHRQKKKFTVDELHENVNILARSYSTSEWMDVHDTIITLVHQEHGHATLHQTTAFLLSFHNIDDELLISGFQKMIDGNEFSIEEICAMLNKMVMIRRKLFSKKAQEEYISYYGNVGHSKYYKIVHQRAIYNNIIENVADRCNENGLKNLLTDTYSVPQYIVDRFFDGKVLSIKVLFHNAVICLSNKDVLSLAVDQVLTSKMAKLLNTQQIEPQEE